MTICVLHGNFIRQSQFQKLVSRIEDMRPPAVERIFVFISIGLEISDTIPCEWGDVLYLLRLSEMKSVIKM